MSILSTIDKRLKIAFAILKLLNYRVLGILTTHYSDQLCEIFNNFKHIAED